MIASVLAWCARHRWTVLAVYAALAAFAWTRLGHIPLDAIPDLSDPQVIVFTELPGRAPALVEDQVTYPLAAGLLAAPRVTAVRGYSMFGMSFVYVLFEEGTDLYWGRSRVVEYLGSIRSRLPADASPVLGPDASGVGWVYQYALVDRSGKHDLGELRSIQDFQLRYALESVPGVAQVASLGGYERQYRIGLDPDRLRAYGLTVADVTTAVRASNADAGGRTLELSGREYAIRGRGYLRGVDDLGEVVLRSPGGVPVRLGDVAHIELGGESRRGLGELDGQGEVAGGIVIARHGENAREVLRRVEDRLAALRPSLPAGVQLITTYDRRGLIERSIDTLRHALVEEAVVVALVIALFLLHLRSAVLPVVTMPLAVLLSFIPFSYAGLPATIMSLGGIAIALGATVDAEIVMIEACHKKLEGAPANLPEPERKRLLAEAAREVTPAIFFSLLIVAAAFLPVFGLEGQAGRLFRPLALTKTGVMLVAAVLSVTLAPALRDLLLRGQTYPEHRHPVSRAIRSVYAPFVYVALRRPRTTVLLGALAVVSAVPPAMRLGSEFMPELDEGDLLFMPTTLPGIAIEEAKRQLELQDAVIRTFPEVLSVHGKAGRAETPTDPAPLSMLETVIRLQPRARWPDHPRPRWYSSWAPDLVQRALRPVWPDRGPRTRPELVAALDLALASPGWKNAWTMPIRNRIDMLATGIRTPVGLKLFARTAAGIDRAGEALESLLARQPGVRHALYERTLGGYTIDVVPRPGALARYGLRVDDLNALVADAIGGTTVTTAVDGRARYPVTVRYLQDFRGTPDALRTLPVPLPPGGKPAGDGSAGLTASAPAGLTAGANGPAGLTAGAGASVPLGEVADVRVEPGPAMLRSEAGSLVGYLYLDLDSATDVGGFVERAGRAVDAARARGEVPLGEGGYVRWSGQYEELDRMRERMKLLVPLALGLIVALLYAQFRDVTEVLIVLLSVPFALVGSVWLLYLLDYRLSTAVWVGIIALIGLATQTGVVMIVYIDQAYEKRLRAGLIRDLDDIIWAHLEGTVQRVRPKLMTVGTMLVGLVPLLWAEGSGADVMKRIAAPMVGGLLTSAFLTLEIIPVIYTYWRLSQLRRRQRQEGGAR